MADKHAAPKSDGAQHAGKYLDGLAGHVVQGARQRCRVGLAVARARIGEHAISRPPREVLRKVLPQSDRTQPLMQQHERRRGLRRGTPTAAFEPRPAHHDPLVLARLPRHNAVPSISRSLKRWIFPVAVFGSSSTS